MTASSDDGVRSMDRNLRRVDGLSIPPALFSTLSAPARRHAVAAVSDSSEPIGVDELVHRIADRLEDGVDDRQFEIELLHVHLPALSDADLLEWHQAERLVSETVRGGSLVDSDGR